jgi:hypothetical protein
MTRSLREWPRTRNRNPGHAGSSCVRPLPRRPVTVSFKFVRTRITPRRPGSEFLTDCHVARISGRGPGDRPGRRPSRRAQTRNVTESVHATGMSAGPRPATTAARPSLRAAGPVVHKPEIPSGWRGPGLRLVPPSLLCFTAAAATPDCRRRRHGAEPCAAAAAGSRGWS